jgi:site-specific recombinase XerC
MGVRRFHGPAPHLGSLAIRLFDLVAVKEMMGHSKLTTTERYLHSRPRPDDAAKLTEIFASNRELVAHSKAFSSRPA